MIVGPVLGFRAGGGGDQVIGVSLVSQVAVTVPSTNAAVAVAPTGIAVEVHPATMVVEVGD